MSSPYHERAICECGWTSQCTFGDIFHLSHRGRFINVCPDCGRDKHKMKVKVLRWDKGTWRDIQGRPYDGMEPEEEEVIYIWQSRAFWGILLSALVVVTIIWALD